MRQSVSIGDLADNLSKAGWSLGYVSAIDSHSQTIWIVDAHSDDGKRFVVPADEKLTAFVELESANGACGDLAEGQSSLCSPAISETCQK